MPINYLTDYGGELTDEYGYITSPLYGLLYTKSGKFTWHITVKSPAIRFRIWRRMEIEMSPFDDTCLSSLVVS